MKDKSLCDMLAKGEIDCAIIARPPDCFRNNHPDVVRLYPDFWDMEEKYYSAHESLADHAHCRAAKTRAGRRTPGWRATSTTRSTS